MADDVLRTRRRRRDFILLCAPSVFSVSAAVRCLFSPAHSCETRSNLHRSLIMNFAGATTALASGL